MRSHVAGLALILLPGAALAQDSLSKLPGYDHYQSMSATLADAWISGSATAHWAADSKSFGYFHDGKTYIYSLAKRKAEETDEPLPSYHPKEKPAQLNGGSRERGRQFTTATSPDRKWKAISRDRNIYLTRLDSGSKPVYLTAHGSDDKETAITTDGSVAARTKNGTASWVYGEELEMTVAMWWSPDSDKLAYYHFDETPVPDYYVTMDEGKIHDRLDTEAYPKVGDANPKVSVFIYDLATKRTVKVDSDMSDPATGEYVYDIRWSDDGKWLLYNRTNRKQNRMQLCAADPATGASHVIVEEYQPQSWADNHPEIWFLDDGHRFVWRSERNGFENYYLYDLDGRLLKTLTSNKFDAHLMLRLDEQSGWLYYRASGEVNPYYTQLRRVRLDGTKDQDLTDPNAINDVSLSPDGKYFTDVVQNNATPPVTKLCAADGKVLDTFVKSDTSKLATLGIKPMEMFDFTAADGKTKLYGQIGYPSNFDPAKKYPVLLEIYGGPESNETDSPIYIGSDSVNPRFHLAPAVGEFGFITVVIAGRGTVYRGKAFKDADYEHLGIVDMDDQNAGVQSLASRPYVDLNRVGVFGTSYGGYSTVMLLLRHPETFSVGCASSPVTDWRNYDSIYTERYMGLLADPDGKAAYEAGSAMKYAPDLKGRLMLYFGSADNNVHPANTYQLTKAFESAGRFYDLQVGTDQGHSQMNESRMWAYLVRNLIVDPQNH
jgi:dipeptidyl-peptidase-4